MIDATASEENELLRAESFTVVATPVTVNTCGVGGGGKDEIWTARVCIQQKMNPHADGRADLPSISKVKSELLISSPRRPGAVSTGP